MKMKMLAIAAMTIAACAGGANAADLGNGGYKDYAPQSFSTGAYDWTGFTVAAGLGGVFAGTTGSVTDTRDGTSYTPFAINRDSLFVDVEAAYNYQFRNSPLVIGGWGEVGYGQADKHVTYAIGGDVGFAYGPARIYGLAGVAFSHKSADPASATNDGSLSRFNVAGDPAGFVYGAGADFGVTQHWRVGVKFERTDWNGVNSTFLNGNVSTQSQATEDRGVVQLKYAF